jgi:hypothetical protein
MPGRRFSGRAFFLFAFAVVIPCSLSQRSGDPAQRGCRDERQGEPRRSSLERMRVNSAISFKLEWLRRNSTLIPRSLLRGASFYSLLIFGYSLGPSTRTHGYHICAPIPRPSYSELCRKLAAGAMLDRAYRKPMPHPHRNSDPGHPGNTYY